MSPIGVVRESLAALCVAAGCDPGDGSEDAARRVLSALGSPREGSEFDAAVKIWVARHAAGSGVSFGPEGADPSAEPRLLLTNRRALLVRTVGGKPVYESVAYPPALAAAFVLLGGTGERPEYKRDRSRRAAS